jgi:hypothetical protein
LFLLVGLSPAYAGDLTLKATAGIDGVVKAGRWTPVLVDAASTVGNREGAVTVSWGDAIVSRDVAFPSPGRKRFEIYVRSAEAEGAVRVQLRLGEERVTVDTPVRVFAPDEPVRLCIVDQAAGASRIESSEGRNACTATLSAEQLPRSVRAYEVVDDLAVGARVDSLDSERRDALARWRALRSLDAAGDLGLTPQPARPMLRRGLPSSSSRSVATFLAVYAALLMVTTAGLGSARARLSRVSVALVAIVVAGAGMALAVSRVAPGQTVTLRHAALLQQFPGTSGAILTSRAVAEFPAAGSYRLQIPVADGMLEPAAPRGRAPQRVTEAGHPVLEGAFGFGARQAFVVEAVVDAQPLRVTGDGRNVTVTNQSVRPLRTCAFADGFSVGSVGTLAPGASVSAVRTGDPLGPTFTCVMPGLPIDVVEARYDVTDTGDTVVAVYRDWTAGSAPPVP